VQARAPTHASNAFRQCIVPDRRYNLRPAYEELRAKLGPYLTEADLLSPRLLLNLSTRWLVWDPRRGGYARFDDLEPEPEAAAAAAAGPEAAAAAAAQVSAA
jgi:hypothetical protein